MSNIYKCTAAACGVGCKVEVSTLYGAPPECIYKGENRSAEWVEIETETAPAADRQELPKLTAAVFDRDDCPEWAQYAVVNMHGIGCFYENEPSYGIGNYKGMWYVDTGKISIMQDATFDFTDWQNSLIERPVKGNKLPEWCKVGEWVWTMAFNAYFKVNKVDGVFISGTDFCSNDYCVAIENARQARLRPYNADEMRGLVGKVVDNPCSSRLVTAYNESNCIKILTSIGWYTADELMTSDYTIDGKPCGALEHLSENGEWVN